MERPGLQCLAPTTRRRPYRFRICRNTGSPVRLEFVVRPPLGVGPGPGSERPNAQFRSAAAILCPTANLNGVWRCNDAWLRSTLACVGSPEGHRTMNCSNPLRCRSSGRRAHLAAIQGYTRLMLTERVGPLLEFAATVHDGYPIRRPGGPVRRRKHGAVQRLERAGIRMANVALGPLIMRRSAQKSFGLGNTTPLSATSKRIPNMMV